MTEDIKNSLQELGLKPNEVRVYLALTRLGEAVASQVAKRAELPRTTAISILNKLTEDGYLTTHFYRGKTYYWIESPKALAEDLDYKKEIAGRLDAWLSDLYRTEAHFPTAKVYDTKAGIKKFIEKILTGLGRGTIIYTVDSPHKGHYAKIFSEDFIGFFNGLKKKKGIITHTLVPSGAFAGIDTRKIKTQEIKIKEMPGEVAFDASLWIIKDTLVLFTGTPPFVVAVKNPIITSSLKSVFDFFWKISETKN